MIWIIIILIIVVISFFLALRSMRNFKEIPISKFPYSCYLILNGHILQNGVLNKLYDFCIESNAVISLERLQKGSEKALVIYAPQNIGQFIPELELLEIEDYIEKEAKGDKKKASVDEVIIWSYEPKNELSIPEDFSKNLVIEDNQNVFLQYILNGTKRENHFQLNFRVMVVDGDVHKRVDLAKKIDQYISNDIGLKRKETKESISVLFENYKRRVLIPAEVEGFIVNTQIVKKLIGEG